MAVADRTGWCAPVRGAGAGAKGCARPGRRRAARSRRRARGGAQQRAGGGAERRTAGAEGSTPSRGLLQVGRRQLLLKMEMQIEPPFLRDFSREPCWSFMGS
jgi:hypothetical protein